MRNFNSNWHSSTTKNIHNRYQQYFQSTTPQANFSPSKSLIKINVMHRQVTPTKSHLTPTKGRVKTQVSHHLQPKTLNSQTSQKQLTEYLHREGSIRNLRKCQETLKRRIDMQSKHLKQKPDLNQSTHHLYKSIEQNKQLPKDVIERFGEYEHRRAEKVLDNLIKTHIQQTKQMPTLKLLMRSNKQELSYLAHNLNFYKPRRT